jgi:hypothetical protein
MIGIGCQRKFLFFKLTRKIVRFSELNYSIDFATKLKLFSSTIITKLESRKDWEKF